jgi:hypothetical protein
MSKADLDKAVAETAKTVESWRANIAAIESQIANAHSRLEKSEAQRKRFALDASLGNAAAITEITKARAEHAAAEGDQADLSHALSQAKARMIEAESEAKIARNNLGRFMAEVLMKKRIEVAGQLDAAISDFARVFAQYEDLGATIINMPDSMSHNVHGMSNHEGAVGARRVAAALPAFFLKFFPNSLHDEQKKESLAVTESRFWFGEPVETMATKAA